VKFINHEVDVLVCTTIIESGLDIPNANTIIINRADQLGLADIYQLRGRVGRSSRQSFAYLLVPSLDSLTKDAKERLRALMDCNELGGGFKLAMNDLQIRGGGNLLGVSQSGHIAAVGYDLYLELLQDTVADLRKKAKDGEGKTTPDIDPEINLKVAAFLPEDYVADPGQRYQLYRRISGAAVSSPEQLHDLRSEVEDRFGPLPAPADMLFKVVSLKYDLARMGVSKLEQAPSAVVFSFSEQSIVKPVRILAFMQQSCNKNKKEAIRFTPDQRLVVPFTPQQELFAHIGSVMQYLLKED
ncbi:MAG: helicase-related protein, partial [Desulfobulbaceae bacterium]|nr:helicase-related protein [Desulfobulbaceae bacterium]